MFAACGGLEYGEFVDWKEGSCNCSITNFPTIFDMGKAMFHGACWIDQFNWRPPKGYCCSEVKIWLLVGIDTEIDAGVVTMRRHREPVFISTSRAQAEEE